MRVSKLSITTFSHRPLQRVGLSLPRQTQIKTIQDNTQRLVVGYFDRGGTGHPYFSPTRSQYPLEASSGRSYRTK